MALTSRLFVALLLNDELRCRLEAYQRRLKRLSGADGLRWVSPDRIHLTLRFLGDVSNDLIEPLQEALSEALRNASALDLVVDGIGAFPNERRPRVLWVGLRGDLQGLGKIHAAVAQACATVLGQADAEDFHPHLTLARVARNRSGSSSPAKLLRDAPPFKEANWRAETASLVRSVLKPEGPEYLEIARMPLR